MGLILVNASSVKECVWLLLVQLVCIKSWKCIKLPRNANFPVFPSWECLVSLASRQFHLRATHSLRRMPQQWDFNAGGHARSRDFQRQTEINWCGSWEILWENRKQLIQVMRVPMVEQKAADRGSSGISQRKTRNTWPMSSNGVSLKSRDRVKLNTILSETKWGLTICDWLRPPYQDVVL